VCSSDLPALETSISHLEDYAACPFKFFVGRGLRAEERPEFEIDIRERGSLQHEALMLFHRRVREQRQRWRELSPERARELIREIGERLCATFRDGLFAGSPDRRFLAGALNRRLQQFIEVSVHWARQYAFDPWQVELGFGLGNDELPAWSLELGAGRALRLRGRIDRVDVLPGDPDQAYLVVIDYKLGGQELTKVKLENGLDLQLLAYLGVLQETPDARQLFGAVKLVPAGAFYVSLLPRGGTAKHRRELLEAREAARRRGYQHRGRFRRDLLVQFDNRQEAQGDQFRYAVKKDGAFADHSNEALPPEDFLALVAHARQRLVQYGQEIFEGNVAIAPYRIQAETACARCLYRAICRFDSWTTEYRTLKCP
jgi:ATP-dependent helicase/nuclease subunit B